MESASLYRDNSSVTPGLHPRRLRNNFYSNRGGELGGGHSSFGGGFEHGGGPQNDPTIYVKIDQMMSMLSSTQQLLLTQDTLEDTVTKLSSDVAAIQEDLSSGLVAKKV